jgi:hypothetical protein
MLLPTQQQQIVKIKIREQEKQSCYIIFPGGIFQTFCGKTTKFYTPSGRELVRTVTNKG